MSTLYPVSLDYFFSQDFNSLRSSGYRLEEMVCGFVFHEYTYFSDDYFLFYIYQGPLKFEDGVSSSFSSYPY